MTSTSQTPHPGDTCVTLRRRSLLTRLVSLAAAPAFGLGAAGPAFAQAYPDRALKIVLMFPPGGGSDSQTRFVADKFKALAGQPLVVDNRPGGGGIIAANAVRNAPGDGYTLLHGTAGMMTLTPAFNAAATYTEADFVPVAGISTAYPLLVAHPSFPANNLKELVALTKAKPGQISYGTWGPGSLPHVAGAWLEQLTGATMTPIPYKGEVPLVIDLLGGQLGVGWATLAAVQQQLNLGKLKVLGVAADQRLPQLPQVTTFIEQGVPGFVLVSWTGVYAPKGTPAAVVASLNGWFNAALNQPSVRRDIESQGQSVLVMSSNEFGDFVRQTNARLKPLLNQLAPSIRQ